MNKELTASAPAQAEFRILGMAIRPEIFPITHRFLALDSGPPGSELAPFSAMIQSGEIERILLSALQQLVSDETLVQLRGRAAPSLCLWRDTKRVLSLSALSTGRLSRSGIGIDTAEGALINHRNPTLVAQLGKDPVCYKRYRFSTPHGLAVFEPGIKLTLAGEGEIASGQAELFSDPFEVIDFAPAEGENHLTLSVIMRVIQSPLVWVFERNSMAAVRAISASDAASRTELLVELFEQAKFRGGLDLLASLQESPFHFLRWRAVQALLKLHTPHGIEAVKRAGADPHPHVRRAAQRTLQNLAAHRLL